MSVETLIDEKGITVDLFQTTPTQDAIGGRVPAGSIKTAGLACFLDQLSGDEGDVQGREGIRATHRLFFNAGTSIDETDYIQTPSGGPYTKTYDLVWVWDPHDFEHHVEALAVVRR